MAMCEPMKPVPPVKNPFMDLNLQIFAVRRKKLICGQHPGVAFWP
jgi:hypothetical protein